MAESNEENRKSITIQEFNKDDSANIKWIITPGLIETVDDFIKLYEYLKGKQGKKVPLMIMGDRGVGKSLFVHIYKTLYKETNPTLNHDKDIVRLNATSLQDTLVDSELFGHVKGAFTGATVKKEGLVVNADLLILEEIGDVPEYVQAKLLTFLEDGKFRPVGGIKEESAKKDVQIIATTNKKRCQMRPDFYDRFMKFTVPPLHKRRVDIFYYLLQFASDVLPELRTWEIMSLLAYHWPGNVRELLAVSMDMQCALRDFKSKREQSRLKRRTPFSLPFVKEEHSEIRKELIRERYENMQRADIDMNLLEELMNCYGLGFDADKRTNPWANKVQSFSSPHSSSEKDNKRDARLGTTTYSKNIFSDTNEGLHFYCDLFLRNQLGNVNLLSVRSEEGRSLITSFPFKHMKKPTSKHNTLVKSILEYCLRQKIEQSRRRVSLIGMDYKKYLEWIRETFNIQVLEPDEDRETMKSKLSVTVPESDLTIYENEDTLIKAWFTAWLKKNNGKRKAMFKALGINEKTGYRHLKKIGLDSH